MVITGEVPRSRSNGCRGGQHDRDTPDLGDGRPGARAGRPARPHERQDISRTSNSSTPTGRSTRSMPTIQQLVRKGRQDKVAKTKTAALKG
ncbi:MAG: hypothetical protein AB7G09_15260, partial [Pseudonocardia sp.]